MITYASYRSPHLNSIFSEIAERRLLVLEPRIAKEKKCQGHRKTKREIKDEKQRHMYDITKRKNSTYTGQRHSNRHFSSSADRILCRF